MADEVNELVEEEARAGDPGGLGWNRQWAEDDEHVFRFGGIGFALSLKSGEVRFDVLHKTGGGFGAIAQFTDASDGLVNLGE